MKGCLHIVGLGMLLGGHLTPRARECIEGADVVFVSASDALVELWVQGMHKDVRSLQPLYREGQSRHLTYRAMVDAILAEVRAGKRVCGAFYGHPGVLAHAPHEAIRLARAEGYEASMEPGISASDALYADLGIDPGGCGCQYYEATQFMLQQRRPDLSAYMVLWQPGIAGDRSMARFSTSREHRALLIEKLLREYPADHPITLYEAATTGLSKPRMQTVRLDALVDAPCSLQTTWVVPPCQPAQLDVEMAGRLAKLDGTTSSQS